LGQHQVVAAVAAARPGQAVEVAVVVCQQAVVGKVVLGGDGESGVAGRDGGEKGGADGERAKQAGLMASASSKSYNVVAVTLRPAAYVPVSAL
jgi:hypothetical protein